eukprot:403374454
MVQNVQIDQNIGSSQQSQKPIFQIPLLQKKSDTKKKQKLQISDLWTHGYFPLMRAEKSKALLKIDQALIKPKKKTSPQKSSLNSKIQKTNCKLVLPSSTFSKNLHACNLTSTNSDSDSSPANLINSHNYKKYENDSQKEEEESVSDWSDDLIIHQSSKLLRKRKFQKQSPAYEQQNRQQSFSNNTSNNYISQAKTFSPKSQDNNSKQNEGNSPAIGAKNPVGRWGNDERARLFKAVDLYGLSDLERIQNYVGTRSLKQIINQANKLYGINLSYEEYLETQTSLQKQNVCQEITKNEKSNKISNKMLAINSQNLGSFSMSFEDKFDSAENYLCDDDQLDNYIKKFISLVNKYESLYKMQKNIHPEDQSALENLIVQIQTIRQIVTDLMQKNFQNKRDSKAERKLTQSQGSPSLKSMPSSRSLLSDMSQFSNFSSASLNGECVDIKTRLNRVILMDMLTRFKSQNVSQMQSRFNRLKEWIDFKLRGHVLEQEQDQHQLNHVSEEPMQVVDEQQKQQVATVVPVIPQNFSLLRESENLKPQSHRAIINNVQASPSVIQTCSNLNLSKTPTFKPTLGAILPFFSASLINLKINNNCCTIDLPQNSLAATSTSMSRSSNIDEDSHDEHEELTTYSHSCDQSVEKMQSDNAASKQQSYGPLFHDKFFPYKRTKIVESSNTKTSDQFCKMPQNPCTPQVITTRN